LPDIEHDHLRRFCSLSLLIINFLCSA